MRRERKPEANFEKLRNALFAVEPEIHNLEGLVAALRIFSEAQDSIEPVALMVLANAGGASLEAIKRALRAGLEAGE